MNAMNVIEVLIRNKMEEVKTDLPLPCKCDKCLIDVFSLTMNRIPPQYASSEAGIAYIKANYNTRQDSVNLLSEILKSCQIVAKSPSHT